jgi:hypothetical protein
VKKTETCEICGAKGFRRVAVHRNKAHGVLSDNPATVYQRQVRERARGKSTARGTEQPQKTGPLHTFTRDEILAARAADAGVTTHTGRVVVVRKQLGERSS